MSVKFVLAINPGSTSTKIAVFENTKPVFTKKISHNLEELRKFKKIASQYKFRKEIILKELQQADHASTGSDQPTQSAAMVLPYRQLPSASQAELAAWHRPFS